MISPADSSKASAGSIVMMSSNAKATTSVSLGVAASASGPWHSSSAAVAVAHSTRREIGKEGNDSVAKMCSFKKSAGVQTSVDGTAKDAEIMPEVFSNSP